MEVPYLALADQNSRFHEKDRNLFERFHESGTYIGGDICKEFESAFAKAHNYTYTVGTASGLDALTLVLLADVVLGKLPKNGQILVPGHTYIATIYSILHAGLTPVICDVSGFHLSPNTVEEKIKFVDAVVGVDIYGKLIDEHCIQIAKSAEKPIYTDSAQAHGLARSNGKKPRAATYSFYPTKNLGAMGDAGAVLTDDKELAKTIRELGNYGRSDRFNFSYVGLNSRLDPLQAGLLLNRLPELKDDNERRSGIARSYLSELNSEYVIVPDDTWILDNAHHVFPVLVDPDRIKEFLKYLTSKNVGFNRHYPVPIHHQPALAVFAHLSLLRTEFLSAAEVSLPCHPMMTDQQVSYVIEIINDYT